MDLRLSLYDFLGYALPGGIVLVVGLILINPSLLEHRVNDPTNGLAHYFPATLIQGILYGVASYFVGVMLRAGHESLSELISKFSANHGKFMKELLRTDSGEFSPYSKQFVCEFKKKIEEYFKIEIDKIGRDKGQYEEIFNFCRMAIMKQSPAIYSRALVLFYRYGSARGMIYVSVLSALGFLTQGVCLCNWILIVLALISALSVFFIPQGYMNISFGNIARRSCTGFMNMPSIETHTPQHREGNHAETLSLMLIAALFGCDSSPTGNDRVSGRFRSGKAESTTGCLSIAGVCPRRIGQHGPLDRGRQQQYTVRGGQDCFARSVEQQA